MNAAARIFLAVFFTIVALVVLAQITGCAPQYREATTAVAEEFRFQEAMNARADLQVKQEK